MDSNASADAGRIFISYRRDDADFAAGWLFTRLRERYGTDRVFEDVHSIPLGADFVEVITAAVQSCAVLLALIGKRWLVEEKGQRRIDMPDDFVRLEIGTALKRNMTVIPVLLDGVRMPKAAYLPPDLRELVQRHAAELHAAQFDADNEPLLSRLDAILAPAVPRPSAVQGGNLPTLPLPGSAGNAAESYAEVAERQAQIQADLVEAQEKVDQRDRNRAGATPSPIEQVEAVIMQEFGPKEPVIPSSASDILHDLESG